MTIERPAILILHGWGSTPKSWERVKTVLEDNGYRVLTPALPGFEGTPEPTKPWSVSDYADWAENYCQDRNLTNVFLLGHSFGGRTAIKFATLYPARLRGLILSSAAGITPRPKAKLSLFRLVSKVGKVVFALPLVSVLREPARKLLYFLSGGYDYYFLQSQIMRESFKKAIAEDLTPDLAKIKTPTLIIWGEKDQTTPLSDGQKMNRLIVGSRLTVVPQGRHALQRQLPDVLAQTVLPFLRERTV